MRSRRSSTVRRTANRRPPWPATRSRGTWGSGRCRESSRPSGRRRVPRSSPPCRPGATPPPCLRIACNSSTMAANCGSNRDAACESSARAISTTSVAENSEIRHTANAFFSSMLSPPAQRSEASPCSPRANATFAASASLASFSLIATSATRRPRFFNVLMPNSSWVISSFALFQTVAPQWHVGRPSPTMTISWHISAAVIVCSVSSWPPLRTPPTATAAPTLSDRANFRIRRAMQRSRNALHNEVIEPKYTGEPTMIRGHVGLR